MNIPSLHGLPCRPDRSARQTMKRGLEIGGSVTQGGSRCAPLPWAIFSLPLRGGRQSLLRSSMTMFTCNLAEDAGPNDEERGRAVVPRLASLVRSSSSVSCVRQKIPKKDTAHMKIPLLILAFFAGLVTGCVSPASGIKSDPVTALRQLDQERIQAQIGADAAALDRL